MRRPRVRKGHNASILLCLLPRSIGRGVRSCEAEGEGDMLRQSGARGGGSHHRAPCHVLRPVYGSAEQLPLSLRESKMGARIPLRWRGTVREEPLSCFVKKKETDTPEKTMPTDMFIWPGAARQEALDLFFNMRWLMDGDCSTQEGAARWPWRDHTSHRRPQSSSPCSHRDPTGGTSPSSCGTAA